MSSDTVPSGSDPGLGRARDERGRAADLYARLDASSAFRPVVVIVTAALAGLLVAPQLATQSYPSDPSLLGTPATANYKAPRDIEVIDEEATARLRETTAGEVRRVYDFDVELGDKRGRAIENGFATMRVRLDGFVADHPEFAGEHLSRGQEQRLQETLSAVLASGLGELEKAIGTTLKPDEIMGLMAARYAAELGKMLAHTMRQVMALPIVGERTMLDADRNHGLTVQRVPDDGGAPHTIADVDSVLDIDAARRDLIARVRRDHADAAPAWRELCTSIGSRLIEANLTPNRAATEVAREVARIAVKPVTITVKKGEMVIRDGERLTQRHLLAFRAIEQTSGGTSVLLAALGAAFTVLLLIALGLGWIPGRERDFLLSSRDILFLATLFLSGVAMARL